MKWFHTHSLIWYLPNVRRTDDCHPPFWGWQNGRQSLMTEAFAVYTALSYCIWKRVYSCVHLRGLIFPPTFPFPILASPLKGTELSQSSHRLSYYRLLIRLIIKGANVQSNWMTFKVFVKIGEHSHFLEQSIVQVDRYNWALLVFLGNRL